MSAEGARPCTHHHFTITSRGRSTASFIKISSFFSEIFNVLCFMGFLIWQKPAIIGPWLWTNDCQFLLKLKPIIVQNVEYLGNQWRYLNKKFCGPSPWCNCKMMMSTKDSATFRHVTNTPTKKSKFFACFFVKLEASKTCIKHVFNCNIKIVEKNFLELSSPSISDVSD